MKKKSNIKKENSDTKFTRIIHWAQNHTLLSLVMILVVVIIGVANFTDAATKLISLFRTPSEQNKGIDEKQKLLLINAFKAGYTISQMLVQPGDGNNFTIIRHRAEAHLEGLAVEPSVLNEYVADNLLTKDEVVVLRDQIHSKVEAKYGDQVAATFIIGTDLIPMTDAFTSYLTDREFRLALQKANISVLALGISINSNINNAYFPQEIKKRWVHIYTSVLTGDGTPESLQNIKEFRDDIVDFFYGNNKKWEE